MEFIEPNDTWHSRDLPVLRATVQLCEVDVDRQGARLGEIAAAAQLSEDDTLLALRLLESDGLIQVSWMNPARAARVLGVTGEAMRRVGRWPTPEAAYDRLIKALEAIAESEEQPPEERSRARKVLAAVGGASREFGIQLGAAVLGAQIGG
ncbi:hypothetical protein [Kribbella sp. VKM Ac-2568]|uniref:hypothetical protein n=1 Tax=Kribbella sp. VKM Ac-2568 TaxID=2512219 RepID=UPI001048F8ED|nr:hypothetical protein [Kribbella sp. VKM Ac-2568]